MRPRLAVLFWFYKEPTVCRNRIRLLRRHNPDTPIFGLYGGDPAAAGQFEDELGPLLDDFWVFADDVDRDWKWRHGDVLIARWFAERGRQLEGWDTVFVAQWDLLVTTPIRRLAPRLQLDEIALSGARPVSTVETWWPWVLGDERARYDEFVKTLDAGVEPMCCLFIVAFLPRRFLARYAEVRLADPERGFLEYVLPSCARAFGHRFGSDKRFRPYWARDPATRDAPRRDRLLNAVGSELTLGVILSERLRPGGQRVFHPFYRWYPVWRDRPVWRRITTMWS